MRRGSRLTGEQGFTLIELMVVVALLAILVAVATGSCRVFTKKTKTVEAETALLEVNRLENLYHETHSEFSSDLMAIGYSPTLPLKYYTLNVRIRPEAKGIAYQAMAKSIGSQSIDSWVLTHYDDGTTVLEKVDSSTTGGSEGGGSEIPSPGVDSIVDTRSFAGKNGSSDGVITIVPLTSNTDSSIITGGSASSQSN